MSKIAKICVGDVLKNNVVMYLILEVNSIGSCTACVVTYRDGVQNVLTQTAFNVRSVNDAYMYLISRIDKSDI